LLAARLKTSTLIYNPIAGRHPVRREKEIQQVAEVLHKACIEVELAPTTGPRSGQELAEAAARRRDSLVLVCGGDGTINEVINGLACSGVPLGVLPGGTANTLAKELRLPHHLCEAAGQVPRWSPRRIALGRATWQVRAPHEVGTASPDPPVLCHRHFVSMAGVGFDAHIVHQLSSRLKMSWGVAGYVLEAFRQLVRYPFPSITLRTNGDERSAAFAVVQRTRRYAGWLLLAPEANLFEPRLTLCLFKSPQWPRFLVYAGAVFARQHSRLRDVETRHTMKVSCAPRDTNTTIRFQLDGELVGTLPADFEIVPDALTLLVP
jgi:diacylglycerol kinase (ATP)